MKMMLHCYILVLLSISYSAYGQLCANYVVVAGDTFSKLASQFQTTVQAITASNPYVNPNMLQIGISMHSHIDTF
jgi:hypothetical protein